MRPKFVAGFTRIQQSLVPLNFWKFSYHDYPALTLLLTLLVTLLVANTAEARLFMQTYGAVVPADPCGNGCTWNTNQDYFIPRYCSSCRYDLFSACKTSCTKSPACRVCHHLYPGYCGIYGNCHYCRRNCLYACRCGCEPVETYCGPYRHGCGHCHNGCRPGLGCHHTPCYGPKWFPPMALYGEPMANVEPPVFEVLGRIPVEGDELLASLNMTPAESTLPGVVLPPANPTEPPLPKLGRPPESLPPVPPAPPLP